MAKELKKKKPAEEPDEPQIPPDFNPGTGSGGVQGDVVHLPDDFEPEPGGGGVLPPEPPEHEG